MGEPAIVSGWPPLPPPGGALRMTYWNTSIEPAIVNIISNTCVLVKMYAVKNIPTICYSPSLKRKKKSIHQLVHTGPYHSTILVYWQTCIGPFLTTSSSRAEQNRACRGLCTTCCWPTDTTIRLWVTVR